MAVFTLSASDMVESAMLSRTLLIVDHVCVVKGLEYYEYLYEYLSGSTASHEKWQWQVKDVRSEDRLPCEERGNLMNVTKPGVGQRR
jgi:hypothetical protein